MNERIRELAEQAGLKWKEQPPHYTNTNNPIDFPVSANRDLEKFAELIVAECLKINKDLMHGEIELNSHRRSHNNALDESNFYIKQYFGVKE